MKKDPKMILLLEAAREMKDAPYDEDEGDDEPKMCTCPKCGHEFEAE